MRKSRIKKNFWFDEEEDKLLKNLSDLSGKTQTTIIKKLLHGATIKEKPPREFFDMLNELIKFKKEIKFFRDECKFHREINTEKVDKLLKNIEELRTKIIEAYLK